MLKIGYITKEDCTEAVERTPLSPRSIFLHNEAVTYLVQSGPAILLWDIRSKGTNF